jgi:hypothetical protein
MAWLRPRCPVSDRERDWIEENMQWLRGEFGDDRLTAPVTLPTKDFFPPPFSGSDADVLGVVTAVARYMGATGEVLVAFTDDYDHAQQLARLMPGGFRVHGAAGAYRDHGGSAIVTLDRSGSREPARLLAVIAHEVGHVRLLGEGRIDTGRADHEPLTDLATVYLGMGVFTANAAFSFGTVGGSGLEATGWRAQRLGYLTEQMFGYALARWALMRGQPDPDWARYLDTNPRVYMKQAIRHIRSQPSAPPTEQAK